MRYLILISMSCLMSIVGFGQDLKSDINVLQSAFMKAESVYLKTKVSVYSGVNKKQLVHSTTASIKKKKEHLWYDVQDNVICINSKHSILVSKATKKIIVSDHIKEKTKKIKDKMDLGFLDSLGTETTSEVKFIGTSNGTKHYEITYSSGAYKKVDIYLSSKTRYLSKIEYTYNPEMYKTNNFVVIDYQIFDLSSNISESFFQDSHYFLSNGNGLTPSSKWKGYSVFNYDNLD